LDVKQISDTRWSAFSHKSKLGKVGRSLVLTCTSSQYTWGHQTNRSKIQQNSWCMRVLKKETINAQCSPEGGKEG